MRLRRSILILSVLLLLAGAWFFWPHPGQRTAEQNSAPEKNSTAVSATVIPAGPSPKISASTNPAATKTNQFPWRLANTEKSIGELTGDPRAILLANALIDTRQPLNLSIPKMLQSAEPPRAFIVQAHGPIDGSFRALLAGAGAQIISYIPNNAYLVELGTDGANTLASDGFSVIPFEPYYKVSSPLLAAVLKNPAQPFAINELKVAAYPDTADATAAALKNLGLNIVAENPSPFGQVFTVQNVGDVAAVARMPLVQRVEPVYLRVHANDLSRATTGVAINSIVTTNYLNLYGSNVMVEVDDSGIDSSHPDLAGRVFGSLTNDTDGHGTHVAGIIAGSGLESTTVSNAAGSTLTNGAGYPLEFRGKAPAATLLAMSLNDSDIDLQQTAAQTNALISNNSWIYDGDYDYDLGAASFDAATRDALPGVTGSQPVLFVFSAGNVGGGGDDGVGGNSDSILSPATAKNVITVGAIEQQRDITNIVVNADGSSNELYYPQTDTSFQVAGFSSRGNVGIGTEGTLGRYKPDVVSPGTFVISTRSTEWDSTNYYYQNPTNYDTQEYDNIIVQPGSTWDSSFPTVPDGAVALSVQVVANGDSPSPFPNFPISMTLEVDPNTTYNNSQNNLLSIPPDGPSGGIGFIVTNQMFVGFNYSITNTSTNEPVSFDVITTIVTTNGNGDSLLVLSNLNNTLGPWYRYESGTSMSAADVSGVLALMQDYFTNTLKTTPSPALLKALLINGARQVGNYNFNEADARNYQGWGLINLPNSIRPGMTNGAAAGGTNSIFFLDQQPTNALATGDSHTFLVNVTNSSVPLRVTLAWTDPPGNPAAAIKLVNGLELIVTNTAAGTNSTNAVFYGNDIPAGSVYNEAASTNGTPNIDLINNVENVYLSPPLASQYAITVFGRDVNVNAVTAHTNNVVQDFALVISGGAELAPATISVTDSGVVSNPTSDQQITTVISTNTPLSNQFAGANTPLLGTNTISGSTASGFATNAVITIGMTNQWHFYIVTNNTTFTNAAFVTFSPATLSIPRMGVFADSDANSTRPEADIDLYVATEAALTNLDPNVISNCLNSLNGDGASLSRGGTEFVTFNNSTNKQIYYVGVKSEDQMAAEYSFLPVFSQTPFSQTDPNGDELVTGVPLPTPIPDGSPLHPGTGYVFGLALSPMEIDQVVVTNVISHQNVGDLIGTLDHNDVNDVLNNHDSLFNADGIYNFYYDDSQTPAAGTQRSDGPGSLNNFIGQQALGTWILSEVDDSLTQTGAVTGFNLLIKPHVPLTGKGVNVDIQPYSWYYSYVDVPVGATNLTIAVTNFSGTLGPLQLYVKLGADPTTNDFDFMTNIPATGTPPGGAISIGLYSSPPLQPGRYYVGVYNPNAFEEDDVYILATIGLSLTGATTLDFDSSNPLPLLDDAVMSNSITVPNTDPIADVNVGIRVNHQRISDLVFHLISPDGSRYLLMENRGAWSTNGAGVSYFTTNTIPVNHNGNAAANTNMIDTGETQGTITLDYNLYVLPDTIDVYYPGTDFSPANDIYTNYPAYTGQDIIGTTNITYGNTNSTSTDVTIIINAGGNTNYPTTAWTYSVTSTQAKYAYLTFTEDTNLTTTPIKFAPTPFIPTPSTPTTLFTDSFETNATGVYTNGQKFGDFNSEWTVATNSINVISNSANAATGTNYVSLGSGSISTVLPTIVGQPYVLQYSYSGADLTFVGGVLETSVAASTNGWQTHYVYFTAAQSGTPITVQGTGPNALLDNVVLTELPPSLYYLPEQSIAPLIGTSPHGTWWLEVQDDRAGAGLTNSLLSWQLQFVLANTNTLVAPEFTNAVAGTNIDMNQFSTVVLTNNAVDANTNATLIYSLINPPADGWVTIDPNTGIITLSPGVGDAPVTNLTITTFVTDGSTPPLSAEDTFTVSVYAVNTPPFWPPHIPSQTNYTITALNMLTVTNTATETDSPPGTLTYTLSTAITNNLPVISTNGIITLSPTLAQQTNVYNFETIVTNYDAFAQTNQYLSATNFFTVTVLPPLSLTNDVPETNTIGAGAITWYLVDVPTNADIATNRLLFANAPLNIWFSTNSPPTVTHSPADVDLITNATSGISILGTTNPPPNIVAGGVYYLGVQNTNSFAVTNYRVEVDFHLVTATLVIVPFVTTLPANTVTGTNAILNGFATPNGLPCTAWFEWGVNTNYGNQTTIVNIGSGNGVIYISNSIVNLANGQTYHFRLDVSNSTTVVYGYDHILGEGSIVLWGSDAQGQTDVPAGLTNIVAIAAGYEHSLALKSDGTVVAWGWNAYGQTSVPTGLSNVVAIAAGGWHSLALKKDGTVVIWGNNTYNQLNIPAGLSNVVEIGAGYLHSVALKSDGTVVAWGNNSFGQLNIPAGLSNLVTVGTCGYNGLAIENNYTVSVWGLNSYGLTSVPAGLSNVVAVAGGNSHSLALKNDGTVVAWGGGLTNNPSDTYDFGQSIIPTGATNLEAISAGGNDSMALKVDGTVMVWGYDLDGETNIPAGLSNVVAISQGYYHDMALTSPLFYPPNTAPFWTTYPPTNTNIFELTTLVVTNTATNTNSPIDAMNYSVSISVNTNAMIASNWPTIYATTNPPPVINPTNGVITWTPSETQGPGIYTITTIVTDTNVFVTTNASLSATNSFTVTVNEVNSAPFWTNSPPPQTVNELSLLTVTNLATDTDSPPNSLTYTVSISVNTNAMIASNWPTIYATTNPPPVINPTNGVITWTPSETQGPGVYTITTIVTDTNVFVTTNASLSATNNFSVTVNEVNSAPFWLPNVPSQNIYTNAILTTLVVTNTATDTDSPPNTLTYSLLTPPTPTGVTINPNTGIITWTPTAAQGNATYTIRTIVTDYNPYDPILGHQHLSWTNSFQVLVLVPPYSATLAATAVNGNSAQLNGFATPNGTQAYAWFEYGTNSSYGNQTAAVPVGNGKNVVFVTNLLSGLSLLPAYHFRLDVSNTIAVTYGFDQILDVGDVVAWGDNANGQTNVPGILTNTAVAISAGLYDSVALGTNSLPIAWGDNTYSETNIPAGLTNAVAIASGGNFNLALRNTRRVIAWGYNDPTDSGGETNVPASLSNVVAIAGGGYHSLALRTNGTVIAWGWNIANETNVPASLSNVVAVAAGEYHSLALKNDGTVAGWGDNSLGETTIPATLSNVVAIAAGNFYSLALLTNGTVVEWGNASEGGTNIPAGLSNVVAIAAGSQHCLALKNDGTVVAWGYDNYGQTNVPAGLGNVVAVGVGGFHSLALVALTPLNPNHPPVFLNPLPSPQTINPLATLIFTNTAMDTDIPKQTLTYFVSDVLGGTNSPTITTNGIITWTPTLAQAGMTNTITTIVTDSGTPPMSATNSFLVFVNPIPVISSVTLATNAMTLHWSAPTNDQFEVRWTTNLAPVIVWSTFPNIITSTNGLFFFTDTNAPLFVKFYELILLP